MQYAINDATKEHVKMGSGEVGVPNHWRKFTVVTPDADGFIKHDGGECPLPDGVRFDAKLRDDDTALDEPPIGDEAWRHQWGESDIIAYRPILDDKKQEWDGVGLPPVGARFEVVEHEWIDGVLFISAKLRPIRTSAQRAEEAMMKVAAEGLGRLDPATAADIYQAIREGRIPGVTLTSEEDNHHA